MHIWLEWNSIATTAQKSTKLIFHDILYKQKLNAYISHKLYAHINNTKKLFNKQLSIISSRKVNKISITSPPSSIKYSNGQCKFLFVHMYVWVDVCMFVLQACIGRNTVVALTLALFAFNTFRLTTKYIFIH